MNEPQELIFEQREVLWAKIRGYPWWPAYVSIVHSAHSPNDYQYTVIFFGDNTNSRLGPSKLRRFPDNYSQFYLKAKTNKKLKQSIQKAQQRLGQNGQNIEMYEKHRVDISSKKKKGTISQSRLSSSEKVDMEAPDLIKYKTEDISRNRRTKNKKKESQIFQQQQSQGRQYSDNQTHQKSKLNSKLSSVQNRRRRSQNISIEKQTPSKTNKLNIQKQQIPQIRSKRITRKVKQYEASPSKEEEISKLKNKNNSKQKILQSSSSQKVEKQNNEEEESSQQAQKKKKVVIQNRGKKRGRKGRPPKAIIHQPKAQQQIPNQNSSQSQPVQQVLAPRRGRKKRIIINSQNNQPIQDENKNSIQLGGLTQQEATKIRQNLQNRKQLSKILLQMPINTTNVKQILDLGVSIALQQGPITKIVHLLLCTLKATLLHKYFPDNNKHRRKYQKMTKQKKKAVVHSDEQENQNIQQNSDAYNMNKQDEDEQKADEEQVHKQKQVGRGRKQKQDKQNSKEGININEYKIQANQDSIQKMKQIREKVVQKLQKMIQKSGLRESIKNYAQIMEKSFQEAADLKFQSYKSVAKRRMRNFKTRLAELSENMASSAQVKDYIQSVLQNYQSENKMTGNIQKSHIKG